MNDAPPLFVPEFFDLLSGRQYSPADAAYGFALELESAARRDGEWRLENGRAVSLTPLGCSRDGARVAFESEGVTGELALAPGPGGWVRVVATIAGEPVFTAFVEQVWEEYELYPAGFAARPQGKEADAPGRVGKRRTWLTLSAAAWPQLAPLANDGGWLRAEPLDR